MSTTQFPPTTTEEPGLSRKTNAIRAHFTRNNLWRRMLKNAIATTAVVAIAASPHSSQWLGSAGYLGTIVAVFGHPGRRFGQMAEALILILVGMVVGLSWSTLGLWLSSLLNGRNPGAGFAVRGVFYAVAAMTHGYFRSKTPRLFLGVLVMVFIVTVLLTTTARAVTVQGVTQILWPILIAVGILLITNTCVFPEFSSGFLDKQVCETLDETVTALDKAGKYFVGKRPATTKTGECDNKIEKGELRSASDQGVSADRNVKASVERQSTFASVKRRLRTGSKTSAPKPEEVAKKQAAVTIKDVAAAKGKIRSKLSACKAAQRECNFEIFVGAMPPFELKPISSRMMRRLVASTTSIIGACESKFALMGEDYSPKQDDEQSTDEGMAEASKQMPDSKTKLPSKPSFLGLLHLESKQSQAAEAPMDAEKAELEAVKPKREIEFGDVKLLRYLIASITRPYTDFYEELDRAVVALTKCIGVVYGLSKLPSGDEAQSISLDEMDQQMLDMQTALTKFDADFAASLQSANALEELQNREPDIMPREEVFLISSFMLNVRQAGTHIEDMLKHARELLNSRNQIHRTARIHLPRIKWSKWLFSGGNEDEALPEAGRRANRQGRSETKKKDDDDSSTKSEMALLKQKYEEDMGRRKSQLEPIAPRPSTKDEKSKPPLSLFLRGKAADLIEWIISSDDMQYAFKLSVAITLVLWPGFVPAWNQWFTLNRGIWAALQLVFVFEVSIGTSILQFMTRLVGVTLGCLWGWASVEARDGNPIVCAAMIFVACFPFAYVQLATKYPKGGMVGIVSVTVVALASIQRTVPGTPTEDFLKRWIAFLIGGAVALVVELTLIPVKARTRMIESIASSLQQIKVMEQCIAVSIDTGEKIGSVAAGRQKTFERAVTKANLALGAAETFLPVCATEPRLKGSFAPQALIYAEMTSVLHHIVDRMENMLILRRSYGSGPLEEFNAQLYSYRRNVAGAITVTLFAIQAALTTKIPLPQFMPSARLAHLRMINKVREVVTNSADADHSTTESSTTCDHHIDDGDDETTDKGYNKSDHAKSVTTRPEGKETTTTPLRHLAVRRKYLSWNASSAAQAEIIEFLEELIELTKLLVGANEFRSGLFVRPQLHTYYAYPPPHPPTSSDGAAEEMGGRDGARNADSGSDDVEAGAATASSRVTVLGDRRSGRVRAPTELPATPVLSHEEIHRGGDGVVWTQSSSPTAFLSGFRQRRRRGTTLSSVGSIGEGEGMASLERIRSRKLAAADARRG